MALKMRDREAVVAQKGFLAQPVLRRVKDVAGGPHQRDCAAASAVAAGTFSNSNVTHVDAGGEGANTVEIVVGGVDFGDPRSVRWANRGR